MRAIAAGGPDAVRVEALAKELGVSKGGFYWHFDDRQALLEETLDTWERSAIEDVVAAIGAVEGDARAKLRHLFELASGSGAKGLFAVELALRDSSRRDREIARRLRRMDDARMDFLRSHFRQFCADEEDAEARAILTYSLFVGSYFIAARHGTMRRAEAIQLALDKLLE